MKRLLIVAAAVTLAACSPEAPDKGVVDDAKFHPAWTQTIPGQPPTMQCSGTPSVCTMSPGTMPQFINWPDRWELRIVDGDRAGWRDVPEITYERCNLGEVFPECGQDGMGDVRR